MTIREIGFDTEMWLNRTQETIFFIGPSTVDNPTGPRYDSATAVKVINNLGRLLFWAILERNCKSI